MLPHAVGFWRPVCASWRAAGPLIGFSKKDALSGYANRTRIPSQAGRPCAAESQPRKLKGPARIHAAGPGHITIKNKHLLVIYSIPTRGFTAVVSVFRGTPPAKPLIAKNRVFHPGAAVAVLWAHLIGGQPWLASLTSILFPGDII